MHLLGGRELVVRGGVVLLLLSNSIPSIESVRLRHTRRPTTPSSEAPSLSPTSLRDRDNETFAPTESPIESLSPSQSMSPTLVTSLTVQNGGRMAYLQIFQEGVIVDFQYGSNLSPSDRDWIGLYPIVDENGDDWDPTQRLPGPSNQPESMTFATPVAFLYGCNSPSSWECTLAELQGSPLPGEGSFRFGKETLGTRSPTNPQGFWPPEPGTYRFYLVRGGSPTNTKFNPPTELLATDIQTITIEEDPFHHFIIPGVRQAEEDIRALIAEDENLGPKFVRLGFHDCIGGCDGCVDMTLADNVGLDIPIDALEPLVRLHENEIFSRADIWALAALVGTDVAQTRSQTKVDFSLESIGRQNCESKGTPCLDVDGNERSCHSKLGPHHQFPESDITTEELFHFFSAEFQFSVQEVVALMGAHTLGSMSKVHSGFDAPNGWVRDNLLLDNDYYIELVGGFGRAAPLEELIDNAPPWSRVHMDNSDLPGIPSRNCWKAKPPRLDGNGQEEIIMLNADVRILREGLALFSFFPLRSCSCIWSTIKSRKHQRLRLCENLTRPICCQMEW